MDERCYYYNLRGKGSRADVPRVSERLITTNTQLGEIYTGAIRPGMLVRPYLLIPTLVQHSQVNLASSPHVPDQISRITTLLSSC